MRWSRWGWGLALLLTFTVSALAAGTAASRLFSAGRDRSPQQAEAAPGPAAGEEESLPQTEWETPNREDTEHFGRTVILVLGVDRQGARSDTNLVAAMDPETGELGMISIPRDTYVEIPGYGWDKLAHAHAYGTEEISGEELTRATVERLLNIKIDHFAVVNFEGFKRVIDAVGGIEIEVTQPMHYDDPIDDLHIHFEPGVYQMNGEDALKYARYRSDSDIMRMARQQEVIKKVVQKATQPASVLRLPELVASVFETVYTDLSVGQATQLALIGRELLAQGSLNATVLQHGVDRYLNYSEVTPDGVYYFVPDMVTYRTLAYQTLFGAEPPAEFLTRAQEAQRAVNAAVARQEERDTVVRAELEAAAAEQEEETADLEGGSADELGAADPGQEAAGGGTGPDAGLNPDGEGGAGGEEGTGADAAAGPSGPEEPTRTGEDGADAGAAMTAALVDASGKDLLDRYRLDLESFGFEVVRARVAEKAAGHTLVIDRSSDPELGRRLQAHYPWAVYRTAEPGDGPLVEVYLGSDAP